MKPQQTVEESHFRHVFLLDTNTRVTDANQLRDQNMRVPLSGVACCGRRCCRSCVWLWWLLWLFLSSVLSLLIKTCRRRGGQRRSRRQADCVFVIIVFIIMLMSAHRRIKKLFVPKHKKVFGPSSLQAPGSSDGRGFRLQP